MPFHEAWLEGEGPWGEAISLLEQLGWSEKGSSAPSSAFLSWDSKATFSSCSLTSHFSRGCSSSTAALENHLDSSETQKKFPCGFLLPFGSLSGQSRVAAQAPGLPLLSGSTFSLLSPSVPPARSPDPVPQFPLSSFDGKDGKTNSHVELARQQRKGRRKRSERR